MSPSRSDTVHLALFPDGAVLSRSRGWLSPKPIEHARYDGAPLEALALALVEPRWQAARLRVVVSNQLVRYALMPANPGLSSIAEELEVAEARFRQLHGAQAALAVRLSDPLSGRAQIAAGMPRDLLEALQALFTEARLNLKSLEPLLVRSMADARPAAGAFCLASVEPQAMLIACHDGAGWSGVSVSSFRGSPPEQLAARLREARLLAPGGELPATLYVHSTGETAPGTDWPAALEGLAVRAVHRRSEAPHVAQAA